MGEVKKEQPIHSYSGEKWRTNQTNKKYLAIDFKQRCAYCDDKDFYYGGQRSFHVEHFAPKEKFPDLNFVYENLFYCCPYCNNAKSDKWPSTDPTINIVGDEGFISPCSNDYNLHLKRLPSGTIKEKTNTGQYMIKELKLYLYRHQLFYKLEQVEERRKKLEEKIEAAKQAGKDASLKQDALDALNKDFFTYYDDWKSLSD